MVRALKVVVVRWTGFWILYWVCDKSINKYIEEHNQENVTVRKKKKRGRKHIRPLVSL